MQEQDLALVMGHNGFAGGAVRCDAGTASPLALAYSGSTPGVGTHPAVPIVTASMWDAGVRWITGEPKTHNRLWKLRHAVAGTIEKKDSPAVTRVRRY